MSHRDDVLNRLKGTGGFPWPPTDADFADGGAYDQNTEEGKRRYEHVYVKQSRLEHAADGNVGAYVPTIQGFTWMPLSDYTPVELVWAITESKRELGNMGPMGYTPEAIAAKEKYIAELEAALALK